MPRPHHRTRSRKRVYKTLPGGGQKISYKREAGSPHKCHHCGRPIAGMPHISAPSEVRKLNRSKRRIWRLHGGSLCHNCLKKALKQAARTS